MEKYITIRDISSYPSYANVNARLVYLHVACNVDVSTYDYSHSIRRLALDLGLSVQVVRTAIKMLERDGLITTHLSTHLVTQGLTHLSTQQLTHLHIVKINELDTTADTTANTTANTPANTTANTPANTQKNNINNKNHLTIEDLTHDARVSAWAKLLEKEFSLDTEAAEAAVKKFFSRQRLVKKTWDDEGDALAHLVAWCQKNLPRQHAAKAGKLSDHDARMAEYQRTEAEKKQQDEAEKLAAEVEKLTRWRREALQRKDKQQADMLATAITDMKARLQTAERRGA